MSNAIFDFVKDRKNLAKLNEHVEYMTYSPAFRVYVENSLKCNLPLNNIDVLALSLICNRERSQPKRA